MRNDTKKARTGHPVTGLILGAAGIAVSLLLSLLFGAVAGAFAAALGTGAVVIGIRARRGGRGAAAIAAGAAAIVLAVTSTLGSAAFMDRLHKAARESGAAPVFSQCFETPYLGISGIVLGVAGDRARLKTVMRELDTLRAMTDHAPGAAEKANT